MNEYGEVVVNRTRTVLWPEKAISHGMMEIGSTYWPVV